MYLVGRDGSWFEWGRAAEALADHDEDKLSKAMAQLGLG
jgi:hypothetical protein